MIKNNKYDSIFKKNSVKKIAIIGLSMAFLTISIFINWYQNPEPLVSVKSINTTPPDTSVLTGPSGTIDYNNVTFTWTGSDDEAPIWDLKYSYKLERYDSSWSSWTSSTSKTYSNLPNEDYTFKVRAKDETGDVDITPAERSFTVDTDEWNEDTTPPDTSVLTGPSGTIDYNNVTFTWTGSDDEAPIWDLKYSYKLERYDSSWSSWTSSTSKTYSNLPNEDYTFKVRAKDETGDVDITPAERSFTVDTDEWNEDTTPPDTSVLTGPSGTIDYNNVTFTWTGSDDVTFTEDLKYSYKLEGYDTDWSSFSSDTSRNYGDLQNGDYTFKVKAGDKAGNIDPISTERAFIVDRYQGGEDTTSPDTTILSGPSGTIEYNDVEFSWIGSDDITLPECLHYSYQLEGFNSSWSSWTPSTSKTYTDLPNNDYTFNVKAKDDVGNIDITPAQQSFTVDIDQGDDTIPPDTSILTGPSGTIDYDNIEFTWTGTDDITPTDDLRYSYMLEGFNSSWSSWTTYTSQIYIDLPNGDYTFKVKAKDEAENIDLTPAQQSFTVEVGGEEPDRFVTSVVEYSGGGGTDLILGGPRGRGGYQGSTHVLSLGIGGSVTVAFDVTIVDGPGEDFIVSENPFFIFDTDDMVFAELVYVEVSTDGITFARFSSTSIAAEPVGPYEGIYPENVTNLAGVYPVYANVDTNDLDPFDLEEAGGDAFDLDELLDDPYVQSGLVDLQDINYIRIIDIIGDGSCLDSQGNPIYDSTGPGNNGADIDSVAVINYSVL